ncbi:hypothetical protein ACFLRZ_05655, partial [Bacteroidota bacterium]
MKYFLFTYVLIIFGSGILTAQELNNFRVKKIRFDNDTLVLDTLSIIPETISISDTSGKIFNNENFKFDYAKSYIIIKHDFLNENQILYITYRVFPYNFSEEFRHKEIRDIEPDEKGMYNPFLVQYTDQKEDIFSMKGLSKSGSISRGISFGNNQDVVVNSNFNLQLSGSLSEDVEILAAVTDNNIPIQPDGNTQQINEFDKVFIQLGFGKSKLTAGDFELKKPNSYFMNFYKKAQGGMYEGILNIDKKKESSLNVEVAAAISKGKFARNIFSGVEGNQGPYKLTGSENESFIVILAGSEKVYIDGRQLDRGQEYDYVIDYNTAEITFTPKRLITKDKRIVVEFEYSDRRYARSLYFVGTEFSSKKLKMRLNAYSEQDLKNQSIQPELTDPQKTLLSNIGDSLNNAISPNIDSIGFTNDQVLYKMIDTLVNGLTFDSVFVYSTNPDSAFYSLGFTNVGKGNGFYNQIQSAANGRVFKWIAPDSTGKLLGSYEPLMLLVTPQKKQMVTLAAEYSFSKNTKAFYEFAYSNTDINLFSERNGEDNQGYAMKFKFQNETNIGKSNSNPWKLRTESGYEMENKYFEPIEPFRTVEFNRDWN